MADGVGILEGIVIDVSDLGRSMQFWSGLLGLEFGPSVTPQCRAAIIAPGLRLVLQQVPEVKPAIKNRVHLDIEVPDIELALIAVKRMGGSLVQRIENPTGLLIVCADADGNEFCLVPP